MAVDKNNETAAIMSSGASRQPLLTRRVAVAGHKDYTTTETDMFRDRAGSLSCKAVFTPIIAIYCSYTVLLRCTVSGEPFSVTIYDIRYSIFSCAQRLTVSRLNLPHGTKNIRIN